MSLGRKNGLTPLQLEPFFGDKFTLEVSVGEFEGSKEVN